MSPTAAQDYEITEAVGQSESTCRDTSAAVSDALDLSTTATAQGGDR